MRYYMRSVTFWRIYIHYSCNRENARPEVSLCYIEATYYCWLENDGTGRNHSSPLIFSEKYDHNLNL